MSWAPSEFSGVKAKNLLHMLSSDYRAVLYRWTRRERKFTASKEVKNMLGHCGIIGNLPKINHY